MLNLDFLYQYNTFLNCYNYQNIYLAIIGDRIFTDILAGNRIGIYTVLVRPITKYSNSEDINLMQKIERNLARLLGGKY